MRRTLWIVLAVVSYLELARFFVRPAGDAGGRRLEPWETWEGILDEAYLRDEFKSKNIPDDVFAIFARAVQLHKANQLYDALREYSKLRHIHIKDEEIDFAEMSRVLAHNLRELAIALLEEEKNKE